MLGNIPAGILVERLGRKLSMLFGLVMIGLSTLGMGTAGNFYQLIGAQLLGGIGQALWMLARHAYMTDVIPIANRGRAIALFGGVNRMGTFVGQFCSIFLGGESAFSLLHLCWHCDAEPSSLFFLHSRNPAYCD